MLAGATRCRSRSRNTRFQCRACAYNSQSNSSCSQSGGGILRNSVGARNSRTVTPWLSKTRKSWSASFQSLFLTGEQNITDNSLSGKSSKPHGSYFRVVCEVSFYALVVSAAVHAEPMVGCPVFSEEPCKSGVRHCVNRAFKQPEHIVMSRHCECAGFVAAGSFSTKFHFR